MIKFRLEDLMKKHRYVDDLGRLQYRRLSRELGISHVWLWKMGANQKCNPSMETIDRLCEHFKCKPGDILEYKK